MRPNPLIGENMSLKKKIKYWLYDNRWKIATVCVALLVAGISYPFVNVAYSVLSGAGAALVVKGVQKSVE